MTTPATPAPLPAEAFPPLPNLARQWRYEADAVWRGARHPLSDADICRRERAKALRECADEFEAAAPRLAAAERDATVTAMYAGAAKAVENAVAAERERCVQLAHEYRAVYVTGNVIEGLETHPFADLLRQDGGARVAEDVQSNDC